MNRYPKQITGTKEQLVPIAQQLMRLGLPTGMRLIDRDTYRIEMPLDDLMAMEKVHITFYNRGKVV